MNRAPPPAFGFHHQSRLASISDHRYVNWVDCSIDNTRWNVDLTVIRVCLSLALLLAVSREEIEVERVIQRLGGKTDGKN